MPGKVGDRQYEKYGWGVTAVNFSSDLLNLNSKTPGFNIVIEGKDVTTVLDARLMSLTLMDNRGFEADQLDLELDDSDGQIVLPRRGAIIQFALGWKGQPVFRKGPLLSMRLSTAACLTVSQFERVAQISVKSLIRGV